MCHPPYAVRTAPARLGAQGGTNPHRREPRAQPARPDGCRHAMGRGEHPRFEHRRGHLCLQGLRGVRSHAPGDGARKRNSRHGCGDSLRTRGTLTRTCVVGTNRPPRRRSAECVGRNGRQPGRSAERAARSARRARDGVGSPDATNTPAVDRAQPAPRTSTPSAPS